MFLFETKSCRTGSVINKKIKLSKLGLAFCLHIYGVWVWNKTVNLLLSNDSCPSFCLFKVSFYQFYMIGFQCSAAISQPCIGRTLFPAAPTHQPSGYHSRGPIAPPSLLDYFSVNGDGLRVTWAHAVNSRAKLNAALRGIW